MADADADIASPDLRQLEREIEAAALHLSLAEGSRTSLSAVDPDQSASVSEARVVATARNALKQYSREPIDRLLDTSAIHPMFNGPDPKQWRAFLGRVRAQLRAPLPAADKSLLSEVKTSPAASAVDTDERTGAPPGPAAGGAEGSQRSSAEAAGRRGSDLWGSRPRRPGPLALFVGAALLLGTVSLIGIRLTSGEDRKCETGDAACAGGFQIASGPVTTAVSSVGGGSAPAPPTLDPIDRSDDGTDLPGRNDLGPGRVDGDPTEDDSGDGATDPGGESGSTTTADEERSGSASSATDGSADRSSSPTARSESSTTQPRVPTTPPRIPTTPPPTARPPAPGQPSPSTPATSARPRPTPSATQAPSTAPTTRPQPTSAPPPTPAPIVDPIGPPGTGAPGDRGVACSGGATSSRNVHRVASDDVLNVRLGPGVEFEVVDGLPPDAGGVAVYDDRVFGSWIVVRIPGRSSSDPEGCGWVHSSFLTSLG